MAPFVTRARRINFASDVHHFAGATKFSNTLMYKCSVLFSPGRSEVMTLRTFAPSKNS